MNEPQLLQGMRPVELYRKAVFFIEEHWIFLSPPIRYFSVVPATVLEELKTGCIKTPLVISKACFTRQHLCTARVLPSSSPLASRDPHRGVEGARRGGSLRGGGRRVGAGRRLAWNANGRVGAGDGQAGGGLSERALRRRQ